MEISHVRQLQPSAVSAPAAFHITELARVKMEGGDYRYSQIGKPLPASLLDTESPDGVERQAVTAILGDAVGGKFLAFV